MTCSTALRETSFFLRLQHGEFLNLNEEAPMTYTEIVCFSSKNRGQQHEYLVFSLPNFFLRIENLARALKSQILVRREERSQKLI